MFKIRRASDRGFFDHGWLKSNHTFSFADYYDPQYMGFGSLRVINQDIIAPASGFGMHGHRNMEIVTYMISGVLEHKDSMGNTSQIRAGELQRMSAGTGVRHSEYNASQDTPAHLLQIWIEPNQMEIQPEYEQKDFSVALATEQLVLIAGPEKNKVALLVHQNARIYALKSKRKGKTELPLIKNERCWVQVISGSLNYDTAILKAGDAIYFETSTNLNFEYEPAETDPAHFLVFALPYS